MSNNLSEELEKAYKERQQRKADFDSRRGGFGLEEKVPLKNNKMVVVRVVDVPRLVYYSFIKCDDEKYHFIKFPDKELCPNHVLYRIGNRVLEREYVGKDSKGQAIFKYPMEEKYPDIFRMVNNNGNFESGRYGVNGWLKPSGYPTIAAYINVINRQVFSAVKKDKDDNEHTETYDKDWCVKHNHSLLLVKNMKSIGVPITVYDVLFGNIFKNFGAFIKYDIAIERVSEKPWYNLFKADSLSANEEVMSCVVQGDISESEAAIAKYDLKAMSQPTKLATIYKFLKNKISAIDRTLGSSFLSELEREIEESGDTTPEEIDEVSGEVDDNLVIPKTEESKKEESPAPARRTTKNTEAEVSGKVDYSTIAPHLSKISAEEISKNISGVSPDGKHLVFKTRDLSSCTNPACNKEQPTSWDSHCIYCGVNFPK